MRKILITGNNGFVGRHFINKIEQDFLGEWVGCDLMDGFDILDSNIIQQLPVVDTVVHLAAKIYVPASFEAPADTYRMNIIGLLNILEYCRSRGVQKFIYISSYVYGHPQYLPVDENHPLAGENPYGRSKVIGEELCKGYAEDHGLNVGIIRPFNLFGIGQDPRFIIPIILDQCLNNIPQVVVNNFVPKRDFLYIKDFVDLLAKLCQIDFKGLRIYNAGGGVSYSVKEVIDLIAEVTGQSKQIIQKGETRPGEILDTIADISKAKKELGWQPRYTLEDGLKEMLLLSSEG